MSNEIPLDNKIADEICTLIASGSRLTFLCGKSGVPSYNVICRWRREDKDFNDMIVQAYADRKADIINALDILTRYGKSRSPEFRRLKKELGRQIGIRYPTHLKKKIDKRRESLIINTGINSIHIKNGKGSRNPKDS